MARIRWAREGGHMRKVDGDALARTTMCPREFSCLENDSRCMCPAAGTTPGGVLLEKVNCQDCPYLVPGGGSDLCTCPTRVKLQEKYGV
jgi:hypothetical protein